MTPEVVLRLADDIERRIQGTAGPRPLLAVPHILSDESSCYYHGRARPVPAPLATLFSYDGYGASRPWLQAAFSPQPSWRGGGSRQGQI